MEVEAAMKAAAAAPEAADVCTPPGCPDQSGEAVKTRMLRLKIHTHIL